MRLIFIKEMIVILLRYILFAIDFGTILHLVINFFSQPVSRIIKCLHIIASVNHNVVDASPATRVLRYIGKLFAEASGLEEMAPENVAL